jgi:tetratricopeptide (TPR) repeat protein
VIGSVWVLVMLVAAGAPPIADPAVERISALERAVAADPENLGVAAEYRQLIVERGQFDRAIDFLKKIPRGGNAGPNLQISLALAYVDKVPSAGDIRRLYLGRDAMAALTRAIAQRPSALAYYLRGVINLYYNRFIFKRTDKGVADLTQALSMVDAGTPRALVARVYTSLGDGYFRLDNLTKAREVWSAGRARCPDDAALRSRLEADGQPLEWLVGAALSADRRADTSLTGLLAQP